MASTLACASMLALVLQVIVEGSEEACTPVALATAGHSLVQVHPLRTSSPASVTHSESDPVSVQFFMGMVERQGCQVKARLCEPILPAGLQTNYQSFFGMSVKTSLKHAMDLSDAPLDAAGFKDTTSLCCPSETEVFFNRLLGSMGYKVCSKPHMQGLMHWFTCVPDMDFQYLLDVIQNGNPCKYWALEGEICPTLSTECAGRGCSTAVLPATTTTTTTYDICSLNITEPNTECCGCSPSPEGVVTGVNYACSACSAALASADCGDAPGFGTAPGHAMVKCKAPYRLGPQRNETFQRCAELCREEGSACTSFVTDLNLVGMGEHAGAGYCQLCSPGAETSASGNLESTTDATLHYFSACMCRLCHR